ncbi:hypothetical protein [Microvirga arabica]|uniref:hypothetical protein n=1 Tax=Microvirga arabica TaxID=1128671 RepID=UPI001939A568|nr:hypothetical protein [Microvirga arabica]MBM1175626.1 hypothetical protein [Microvirga arabica]
MLKQIRFATLIVAATFALPAVAANPNAATPPNCGNCQGNQGQGVGNIGSNKGAPGPIAGAGLPFLLIAGGYALVRRYRNRSRTEQAS